MVDLGQKIAQKQDELARLKEKKRKLETGQKIIVGGMMLSMARKDPEIAQLLLDNIRINITKDIDLNRVKSLISELEHLTKASQK